MSIGDIIFEQGVYKIHFVESMGPDTGHKGFKFCLLKEDTPYKYYTIATGYPYNYGLMKSTVIGIFKKLMI